MKTPPSRISLAPLILACAVPVAVTTTSGHAQPCGGYEVTAIIQTPVDCGFGFDITTGKKRCQDDLFESSRGHPRGWSRPSAPDVAGL